VDLIESDVLRVGHIADEWGSDGEDDEFEEQEDEGPSLNATSSWSKEDDIWAASGQNRTMTPDTRLPATLLSWTSQGRRGS
jgi:hypothetical protein